MQSLIVAHGDIPVVDLNPIQIYSVLHLNVKHKCNGGTFPISWKNNLV